jgi:hypothetical protein
VAIEPRIGLLVGREWSFPPAFIERVGKKGSGIVADYIKLDATRMAQPVPYTLIIDRISHEVGFYRTFLKHATRMGVTVVNNPFMWSADDKFYDATIAVQHGVEVVYVSNHGGRQLDHGLGSTAVLPGIIEAIGKKAEVWVDGGYMRGSDIVKAMALGAKAVGLGRLTGLGLGAAGVPGLVRTLELLEDEIRICLGLLGVTSYAELTPAHLVAAPPANAPDTFSAFPLLTRL